MNPLIVIGLLIGYFAILILISFLTSKETDQKTFFTGNRDTPWYIIAFGMIGSSISGVTFISVPGKVGSDAWHYIQIVLGYWVGYMAIIHVLLPLYYRHNVTSIYQYLEQRLGLVSYKTGAWLFLVSRLLGSSLRLYLVALVLQTAVFDHFHLPFPLTVLFSVLLIYIYTFKAGVKTIIWTDTIQTVGLLAGLFISIYLIAEKMDWGLAEVVSQVFNSKYSEPFVWNPLPGNFFLKAFLGGAAITIAMTGLDQDMMQKNLACRTLEESQKNMYWFSAIMVGVNICFLALGVLLYLYGTEQGILKQEMVDGKLAWMFKDVQSGLFEVTRTDKVFTKFAFQYLGAGAAFTFIVGVVAATYASADAALTSLTTSFCVDILDLEKQNKDENQRKKTRTIVHISISLLMWGVILFFHSLNDAAVIDKVLDVAGYTYGPLVGLFIYSIFTQKQPIAWAVPLIAVASPAICYFLKTASLSWSYQIGLEILIINGLLTFFLLLLFSRKSNILSQSV